MISNNKILTVSYGTFSCTLEGFEDNFGTMKAIAEYFRDLAADDRYFGSEPPQPDAEMLARIAEREIERRVQASKQDGTYVLRAGTETPVVAAAALASTAAVAQVAESTPIAEVQPSAPLVEEETASEPVLPVEDAIVEDDIVEVAADEVEEIAVEETPAASEDAAVEAEATDVADDAATDKDDVEDIAMDAMIADAVAADEETDNVFADSVAATDDVIDEVEDVAVEVEDNHSEAIDADDIPAPELDAPRAQPASIAAKLQRIRDVVAKNQNDPEVGYTEDEHAEELVEDQLDGADVDGDNNPDYLQTAFEDDAALEADEAVQVLQDAEEDADVTAPALDETDDDTANVLAALAADFEYEAGDASEEVQQASVEAVDVSEVDDSDEVEENEDDVASILAQLSNDLDDEDDFDELEAELEAEPEPEVQAPRAPRARVVKVKRADLEAAIETGTLEEVDQPDLKSSLSSADEDDLMRELAEVEAELADGLDVDDMAEQAIEVETVAQADVVEADDADDFDPSNLAAAFEDIEEDDDDLSDTLAEIAANVAEDIETDEETAAAVEAGASSPLQMEADDDALERLMAEAETQMEEPEGTSRRAAFDHLRAAVVATRQDDKLNAEAHSEEDDDAYRTDLAQAVKPRRPVTSESEGEARQSTDRPAPLKLVAEQRIDTETSRPGPVSPRRVSADAGRPNEEESNFADYAAARGAHALSDLLEAAASYLSFVEGRDQFSRPQLMTKVRQVDLKDFSREDGLRSFGQLLRAGKIEKIKGGRFTVSEDIGFRPDQRAAS